MRRIHVRFAVISAMILMAAVSRLIPHPSNFAPIGGMALFAAAYFDKKLWAYVVPIVSMWLSDLLLNNVIYGDYFSHFVWFYPGSYWTYVAFAAIACMGLVLLKKIRVERILVAGVLASMLFFVLSNFGVWFSTDLYPKTREGLMLCYAAGLPFLKNTFLGDVVYTAILFGSYEVAIRKIPFLVPQRS